MKKSIKKTICFVICLALVINMSAIIKTNGDEGKNEVKKVLFIGNSMTFYNNLWNVFQGIAKRNGHDVEVESATNPGKTILYNASAANCVEAMKKGGYDVVVLQDLVGGFDADILQQGVDKIVPIIKKFSPNAKIVFYEPWPVKNMITKPGSYLPYFTDNYIKAAQKVNGDLAPAGEGFYELYVDHNKNYYCSDGKHPTPLATFLAASTVYFAIYKDEGVKKFEESEHADIDSLIINNIEHTNEGVQESYSLDELNLIYSIGHKYARAVQDATSGKGKYVSRGYEPPKTYNVPKVKIKKAVKKKKSIKITLKKMKGITGYQVFVSKKKSCKKKLYKKTTRAKKAIKKGIITIKSSKFKAKKLFVKVRAFIEDEDFVNHYGKWSKVKRVKA